MTTMDISKSSLEKIGKKGKHSSRSISARSKDYIKMNIGAVRTTVKLPQAPQKERNIIEFLDQDQPIFMRIQRDLQIVKANYKGSPQQEYEELLVDDNATPRQDHHKF
jgi:hypothetical protein